MERATDDKNLESHFEFGKNWENLVRQVDDTSVAHSVKRISTFLERTDLKGLSFLDIGCGSGLSSLAAYRLGAKSITSVDIDPQNIANVKTLREKFSVPKDFSWQAWQASIVDGKDLAKLPKADVVYSWGVLHHTGAMWEGLGHCASLVEPGGLLYIMLYRDAYLAGLWKRIKYTYTVVPRWAQSLMRNSFAAFLICGALLKGKNPLRTIREYGKKERGMSWYVDVTDWVGGYPFEYASADETTAFLTSRGFEILKISPKPDGKFNLGYRGTGSYEYLARKR
jgi:SAM-dependent methyltransferase